MNQNIMLDDGFQFGLGVFETIAVERGNPIFLSEHLKRLRKGMRFLDIRQEISEEKVEGWLTRQKLNRGVLKIIASKENLLFTTRENHYAEAQYKQGFMAGYSKVLRNESSPLTYHKTLNYGDCILEKRRAASLGLDELIFCNSRGEICEGTTTNIFFCKGNEIYSPKLSCGLLPGIMRDYVCRTEKVRKTVICPEEAGEFDECFLTNSLLGIMPVRRLGDHSYSSFRSARKLWADYSRNFLGSGIIEY